MFERVCGIRMRGRARLEGKQVPQNESLKGFEPLTSLRYQVMELKEACSVSCLGSSPFLIGGILCGLALFP